MNRVAIFVDAGYFFAQSAVALTGERKVRGQNTLAIKKLMECLEHFATSLTKAQLLRIYWYDGTATGPSSQHIAIAIEANVKLRLGFVNAVGQQKGVDSLIITDMIALARNRAMSDAVLLSGDEDLRVGVQQAQEFGVRVHLLGISSHAQFAQKYSQSQFLLQEADTTHMWTAKELAPFLSFRPKIESPKFDAKPIRIPSTNKPNLSTSLEEIAKQYATEIDPTVINGLVGNYNSTKQIPPEIDRPLLGRVKRLLSDVVLTQDQKGQLRKTLVDALTKRLAQPADVNKSS